VRGVFWDAPNAAAAWFFGEMYSVDDDVELWNALDSGPGAGEFRERYAQAVKQRIDQEHANAKFLADHSPGALSQIEAALQQHWTKIAVEYYDGDWQQAAREVGGEATNGVLNAAFLVAPGEMVRLAGLPAAADAVKAKLFAQGDALAAPVARAIDATSAAEVDKSAAALAISEEATGIPAEADTVAGGYATAEEAPTFLNKLPSGLPLSPAFLHDLAGFTAAQLRAIEFVESGGVTGGRRIMSFFFPRSVFAARAEAAGARAKPFWMHPKSISLADKLYLYVPDKYLSLQAYVEPPFFNLASTGHRAEALQKFLQVLREHRSLSSSQLATAEDIWNLRTDEWLSSDKDQVRALIADGRRGSVQATFPQVGNFTSNAYQDITWQEKFQVVTEPMPANPLGEKTIYIPEGVPQGGSRMLPFASDQDPALFVYENMSPLSDADREAVYKYLYEQGVIEHPDAGTYANSQVRNALMTQGRPVIAFGPGQPRLVRINARLSQYVDPGNYRWVFDGAIYVPNSP